MPRPTIDRQITFLYTRDLATTARFYEQILGLPLVLDQGSCRREAAPEQPTGIILTIVTDEVDEWYRYLKAQNVDFKKLPTYNPDYNIYHCFLRDPNGYLIEIQRFLDPTWPEPVG